MAIQSHVDSSISRADGLGLRKKRNSSIFSLLQFLFALQQPESLTPSSSSQLFITSFSLLKGFIEVTFKHFNICTFNIEIFNHLTMD